MACLPYEFDLIRWGSHPGCRMAKERRRAEPKSGKSENRGIMRDKKVPQKQKDDAPEQQRVGANCRRSKLNDLKAKKSTAVPGHHCLMLAVSTLR